MDAIKSNDIFCSERTPVIDLNTEHSEFDMAMEVLCSIPPYPGSVDPDLLCSDLGISRERLQGLIGSLYLRDVAFRVNARNGGGLSYPPHRRMAVDVACLTYWGRVNEGKDYTSYQLDRTVLTNRSRIERAREAGA